MSGLTLGVVGFRFLGLQAATWAALAAWATLAVLIATAWFAASQIREARRLRHEGMRPFVVVDFDTAREPQFIYVTIENTGRTVATDVQVTFEPSLASAIDAEGTQHVDFFQHVFPTLPPGKVLASLLDHAPARFNSDLPGRYTATVSYRGHVTAESLPSTRTSSTSPPS